MKITLKVILYLLYVAITILFLASSIPIYVVWNVVGMVNKEKYLNFLDTYSDYIIKQIVGITNKE